MKWLRPRTIAEQVEEKQADLERRNQRVRGQREQPDVVSERGYIVPGRFVKGDTFPESYGIYRDRNNWMRIEERLLNQHLLVVGGTGMGKSVTLARIVSEVLSATDRDIFIVDGKGEEDFALDMANRIYSARGTPVPWFRLGLRSGFGAPYHGLEGDAWAVFNRLAALCGIQESKDHAGAAYYAEGSRSILQLICFAPVGPPRSLYEVRERVSRNWLKQAYQDDPFEQQAINELDKAILSGLTMRVRSLAREFGKVIAPSGFRLEDTPAAIFSIRAQSVGLTAERFLQFLVEDIKDFVGNRQKRPGLLIIDEFGVFDNENIINLLALARSAELGVILATQDVATLGDEQNTQLIMANTMTKLLMGTQYPQEIAELAGTIEQIEASIQHQEGDPIGVGSARVERTFRVDPNEVLELLPGEAFLIRQGRAAKLAISQVNASPHNPEAIAADTGKTQPEAHEPTREEKGGIPDLEL